MLISAYYFKAKPPANIETKMVKAGDIELIRDQCACGGGALPLANSSLKVPGKSCFHHISEYFK